jgi:hypothetical protein
MEGYIDTFTLFSANELAYELRQKYINPSCEANQNVPLS